MSTLANLSPHRRAVFVSDVHLGSRHCHATELARSSQLRCERLYLVGDIIDLWWMAHRRANWRQSHSEVIQALHALRRAGTEIIYIPGNHDASLRQVCGLMLPAMQVRRRAIHVTADGRRLLVAHGDDYDGVTHFGGLQEKFGDWLYYRIPDRQPGAERGTAPAWHALLVAVGVPEEAQRGRRTLHRALRAGRAGRRGAAWMASSAATSTARRWSNAMAWSTPTTATGWRA